MGVDPIEIRLNEILNLVKKASVNRPGQSLFVDTTSVQK